MGLTRRTAEIAELMGPVRVGMVEIREIHRLLSYGEPDRETIIHAGDFEAAAPDDLLDIPDATIPKLTIMKPYGLSVHISGVQTVLLCRDPKPDDTHAALLVGRVLRPRSVAALDKRRLFIRVGLWAALMGLIVVVMGAVYDLTYADPLWWAIYAGSLALSVIFVRWLVRRPAPDPVVLHPDKVPLNLLRRYEVELTLLLLALGVVIAAAVR